jgi:hypothetical protein
MDIAEELVRLRQMTVCELRQRYAEVFSETTTSRHKLYLQRRILWGMQARAHGGLTSRALARAAELASLAHLRLVPPRASAVSGEKALEEGPAVGAVLTRKYKGRMVTVAVTSSGYEYEGRLYQSLSAVAKAVTGGHWSGRRFFGLKQGHKERKQ